MATTPTTNLSLLKHDDSDLDWGTTERANLDLIDSLFTQSGTSNPTGSVTPSFVNQLYVDTTNAKAYIAKGTTSADWVLLNTGVSPHHNIAVNGSFAVWQRGTSGSAGVGTFTYLADRFFVNPSGAGVTVQRSTAVRTGSKGKYSLQVDGASSVTTVGIGQRMEAFTTRQLLSDGVTISAYIYNNTATSSFSPTIELHTANAENDFSSRTLVATLTPGIACPQTAWTRVYASVNAAAVQGYSGIENGLQVAIVIPSGALVAGDTVRVGEFQIQEGTTLTTFLPRTLQEELDHCQRYYFKTYPQDVAPGTATFNGCHAFISLAASNVYESVTFPKPMVKNPSVTFYSPNSGAAGYLYGSNDGNMAAIVHTSTTANPTAVLVSSGLMAYNNYTAVHVVANAEL
jgi:hypothetical protein